MSRLREILASEGLGKWATEENPSREVLAELIQGTRAAGLDWKYVHRGTSYWLATSPAESEENVPSNAEGQTWKTTEYFVALATKGPHKGKWALRKSVRTRGWTGVDGRTRSVLNDQQSIVKVLR